MVSVDLAIWHHGSTMASERSCSQRLSWAAMLAPAEDMPRAITHPTCCDLRRVLIRWTAQMRMRAAPLVPLYASVARAQVMHRSLRRGWGAWIRARLAKWLCCGVGA